MGEERVCLGEGYRWVDELERFGSFLVYGVPGCGKSSFVNWVMQRRAAMGHFISVCDCSVMEYEQVNDCLRSFLDEANARFQLLKENPLAEFDSVSLLCEDFTDWFGKVPVATDLFLMAMENLGALNMSVVFVTHDRIVSELFRPRAGFPSGVSEQVFLGIDYSRAAAFSQSLFKAVNRPGRLDWVELELMAKPGDRGVLIPKMEGFLKVPFQDRKLIKIAPFMVANSLI